MSLQLTPLKPHYWGLSAHERGHAHKELGSNVPAYGMKAENLLETVVLKPHLNLGRDASTHCEFCLPGESAAELSERFDCLVLCSG